MTVAPALMQVEQDTRSPGTTPRPRLRTAEHKLTSVGEFSRRSEQLVDGGGVQNVQALGAWLQLWTCHSRSDGTIWLTAAEAAEALGVAVETWRRWAGLLTAAQLLAPHGKAYLVPHPAAVEGCLPGLVTPGGWRSLHRTTFAGLVERLAAQGVAGPQRAGVLGVFAVVLLRHTYGRAGHDVVQPTALPALHQLLDRKTVSAYLGHLAGVLDRPCRGRLVYVGRDVIEQPWAHLTPAADEPVVSPFDQVAEPAEDRSFPHSHAQPSRSGTPLGQDRTPGEAGGTFVELLTALDRRAPGAARAIAQHRLARALLRTALLETGCQVEHLVYELTRASLADARDLAGVLAHRVPDAVEVLRLRTLLDDQHARAERQAYATQDRRELLAFDARRAAQEAASARAAEDLAVAEVEQAAGDDWLQLLDVIASRYSGPIRVHGRALEAAARAAVRETALAGCVDPSQEGPTNYQAAVQKLLREA
jgi:hypothetical protein